ncbi:MAG: phage tail tape measure protein [Oscillospiraceae bacterium]|nr:phage tail tape measure protein [Oscillospiraceae bacterium]
MATRTISTKLAITGESEYRASLSKINSELKSLASQLKLTESQYQTNANSMQALQAKGKALSDLYQAQKNKVQELRSALDNAKQAEQKYAQQKAELQKKIEENNKALEKLKQTTGDTSKEEARLTEENAKLQKELQGVDAKLAAAEKGTNNWQTQLNNAEIQLNNLDAEIQKNDKYLDEAAKSSDGCAHSIDEFGREVDETKESVQDLSTVLASAEFQQVADKLRDALMDCARASMEFEVGMAAVKRTTGITGPELEEMGNHFKQLSTEIPITTQELTAIATTAGQLGVKGRDNVEAFTEVMAQLATTTDLTADTAATMLAQFANITGMKTASDYEHLGSVVASLGDATATTATKVVEMSQGIAATGTLAGMSATDIMAISAAVGSLGIESAAGSTAMSTLISTLYKATQTGGEKLDQFASVAGMSGSQFRQAWGEDAVGALNAFITGLNDTERNGQSAILILDELGITNVRQTKAILGLAAAGDLLTGTIEQANQAWEENTALQEKAGIMYDTAQAKVTQFENATNNLKIAIGDALAPTIIDLAEKGQTAVEFFTKLTEENPKLTSVLVKTAGAIVGVTSAFVGLQSASKVASLLGFTKTASMLSGIVNGASSALGTFTTALGGVASAAPAVAVALLSVATVIDHFKETEKIGFLGEGHTLEEYAANVEAYKAEIVRLQEEYDNLAMYGGDLTMAQDALDMATLGLTHATEEYTAAQEAAKQATEESAEATGDMTAANEAANYVAEEITMSLGEMAQAYKDAYDEAKSSLEGQISLFDAYAAEISEDTDTAQEMLDLWAQQTANLGAYTENLKKAAEYGLDTGLVQSLADGSTESAGYLATIIGEIENAGNGVSGFAATSEEAVEKFNAAFKSTEDAKTNLAETMAAINTSVAEAIAQMEEQAAAVNFDGFYEAVDTAFADVGLNFEEIGGNMGTGLSTGITGSTSEVEGAAKDLVSSTTEAAQTEAGVHSPSTVWREIGTNLDQGLAEGIKNGESIVISSVKTLSAEIKNTMFQAGLESAEYYARGLRDLQSRTQSELQELKSTLSMGTYGMYEQMFAIGSNIVGGMINGIYSQSGYLYQAVYSVTANAISAARAAAAVSSPSRKTKEIFEYVGEGMAVGIESKKERVATATEKVVDNALRFDTSGLEKAARLIKASAPDMRDVLYPALRSAATGSSDSGDTNIDIHIGSMVVREEADIRKISRQLAAEIKLELRGRGNK